MTLSWEKVVAHALSLPGTEEASHYGGPSVKVNGRAILAPGREAGSFCLMVDLDMVEMLKETDPDTYWQTPHYEGWPGVLVRYDTPDPERVLRMTEASHAWNLTRKPPKPRKSRT